MPLVDPHLGCRHPRADDILRVRRKPRKRILPLRFASTVSYNYVFEMAEPQRTGKEVNALLSDVLFSLRPAQKDKRKERFENLRRPHPGGRPPL